MIHGKEIGETEFMKALNYKREVKCRVPAISSHINCCAYYGGEAKFYVIIKCKSIKCHEFCKTIQLHLTKRYLQVVKKLKRKHS